MRLAGAVAAAKRRWIGFVRPAVVVLVYHRIAPRGEDPHNIVVTPGHFAEHIAVLRRWGTPMRLRDLPNVLAENRIPRRRYIITFDDGYTDNLFNAKPILETYDTPATVFAASAFAPGGRECWWDMMHDLMRFTRDDQRTIECNGKLFDVASWNEFQTELFSMSPPHAAGVMNELFAQAGIRPKADAQSMTSDQLCNLVRCGLIDVGAHTVNHRRLAAITEAEQREEIVRSRQQLEAAIGQPVETFAYPFGAEGTDFTETTRQLVREAGYICACAVRPAPVTRGCNPYALPRYWVSDWNGDELDQRLRWWSAR